MKIGANASTVLAGCVQNQVVNGSGAEKPARESDREAERHNALLPLSTIASTRRRFSTQEASSGRNPGGTHAGGLCTLRRTRCPQENRECLCECVRTGSRQAATNASVRNLHLRFTGVEGMVEAATG